MQMISMFICSPGITQNAANLCKDLITVNLGAICQSWHKDPCKKVDPGRGGGCTERRLVTFSKPISKGTCCLEHRFYNQPSPYSQNLTLSNNLIERMHQNCRIVRFSNFNPIQSICQMIAQSAGQRRVRTLFQALSEDSSSPATNISSR